MMMMNSPEMSWRSTSTLLWLWVNSGRRAERDSRPRSWEDFELIIWHLMVIFSAKSAQVTPRGASSCFSVSVQFWVKNLRSGTFFFRAVPFLRGAPKDALKQNALHGALQSGPWPGSRYCCLQSSPCKTSGRPSFGPLWKEFAPEQS